MRALREMATIQIELTSRCVLQCANCTRFVGHRKPFDLSPDEIVQALDSLIDIPDTCLVGCMGGEPLLSPHFEFFCEEALKRFDRMRLGLWSVFPKGKEKYREVICRTFGNIFLNDHSRSDIMHAPLLVASGDIIKDKADLFMAVDRCWVQNTWSASINPKGAFFCEVAAAMADLFDGPEGWKVEPGWWKRVPKDFTAQMEEYCVKCGGALPLKRRSSQDTRDDISKSNLERLKGKSRKIERGEYVLGIPDADPEVAKQPYPDQVYKDIVYRKNIANRYGIFLTVNAKGFLEPGLKAAGPSEEPPKKNLFQIYQEEA